MKTPRDILLERHGDRIPALDEIRERVISREFGEPSPGARRSPASGWPGRIRVWTTFPRLAWGGFAAVWCVILGLNLAAGRAMGPSDATNPPTDLGQVFAGFQKNRAELAALLVGEESREDSSNRKAEPGPRSDAGRIHKDTLHLETTGA